MIDKKKQMRMTDQKGGYIAENKELFQELKEIKESVEEVKKILNNKEKSAIQPDQIKRKDTKIIKLGVQKNKLIAWLNDGRELSVPIVWFKKWGVKNVTSDKLKNYEIKRGKNIYFPDIDEVLGMEVFIHGFDAPCE